MLNWCNRGLDGWPGPPGPEGLPGMRGECCLESHDGPLSVTVGPKGEPGNPGEKGEPGISVAYFTTNLDELRKFFNGQISKLEGKLEVLEQQNKDLYERIQNQKPGALLPEHESSVVTSV